MENQGSITSVSDAASSTHGKKLKEKHEQLSKHLSEILKSSKGRQIEILYWYEILYNIWLVSYQVTADCSVHSILRSPYCRGRN